MFSYLKSEPGYYFIQYVNGAKKRKGAGLAFWYFAPTTTIVKVPINSIDLPFIFEEVTADYQQLTVQGQLTYRIINPEETANVLDFSVDSKGIYQSDDPQKISKRLVNQVQVFVQNELQKLNLVNSLQSTDSLTSKVSRALKESPLIDSLGLELINFSILAVKPNPETLRALESTVREDILKQADEARYDRRNAAVEQERTIKENEFNTEIALEKKRRQVEEEKLNAKESLQRKSATLEQEQMQMKVKLEEQNSALVALETENKQKESEAKAYEVKAMMQAYENVDPKTLQAMAMVNMDSTRIIASAFNELAENAGKIGQLNIAPELLNLLTKK